VSGLAHAFWPRWYRLIRWFEPLMAPVWRRGLLGNTVRVVVAGRRSGAQRTVYLGVLRVAAGRYLGHPDGECAWTRNLEAAGGGRIVHRDGRSESFRGARLGPGPERDAVIRATFRQHPFPATVFYWLSRRHLAAVGRFYRIEPSPSDPGAAGTRSGTVIASAG
jgi:hypothetical protein